MARNGSPDVLPATTSLDDLFQHRLSEVHRELDTALKSHTDRRAALKAQWLGLNPQSTTPASAFLGHAYGTSPATTMPSDRMAMEVGDLVTQHLKGFDTRMQNLVAAEWSKYAVVMESALRDRFTELGVMVQESNGLTRQVAESLVAVSRESKQEIGALERRFATGLDRLRQEVMDWKRETAAAVEAARRETVEAQSSHSVERAETLRRLDAAQRRYSEASAEASSTVEAKINALRDDMDTRLRGVAQKVFADVDMSSRMSQALANAVRVTEDTVSKMYVQLADALDSCSQQNAAIREIRSDVAAVDAHTRDRIDRLVGNGPSFLPGASTGNNPVDCARLQRDLFAVKQCVAYVAAVLRENALLPAAADSDVDQQIQTLARAARQGGVRQSNPTMAGSTPMKAAASSSGRVIRAAEDMPAAQPADESRAMGRGGASSSHVVAAANNRSLLLEVSTVASNRHDDDDHDGDDHTGAAGATSMMMGDSSLMSVSHPAAAPPSLLATRGATAPSIQKDTVKELAPTSKPTSSVAAAALRRRFDDSDGEEAEDPKVVANRSDLD